MNFKRIKSEEGYQVHRWFQCEDIIISVVDGYLPDEWNVRVSGNDFESFEIRGHKSILEKKTDKEITDFVETALAMRVRMV